MHKVKPKILEKNIEEKVCNLGLNKIFIGRAHEFKIIEEKIGKLDLIKILKVGSLKDNIKKIINKKDWKIISSTFYEFTFIKYVEFV